MAELLAGVWSLSVVWLYGRSYWCPHQNLCPATAVLPASVPYLGAILALIAVLSVVRMRLAFVAGGVLCSVIACIMAIYVAVLGITSDVPLTLLSAAAAVLSFLASRRAHAMPEEYNPMNLPVFGYVPNRTEDLLRNLCTGRADLHDSCTRI